jgi:hypothetical protein
MLTAVRRAGTNVATNAAGLPVELARVENGVVFVDLEVIAGLDAVQARDRYARTYDGGALGGEDVVVHVPTGQSHDE